MQVDQKHRASASLAPRTVLRVVACQFAYPPAATQLSQSSSFTSSMRRTRLIARDAGQRELLIPRAAVSHLRPIGARRTRANCPPYAAPDFPLNSSPPARAPTGFIGGNACSSWMNLVRSRENNTTSPRRWSWAQCPPPPARLQAGAATVPWQRPPDWATIGVTELWTNRSETEPSSAHLPPA